ncbi:MAG: Holliday junction DNA helicase RuvA [Candidatus Yonathbacteria bacterium RIFCSPHIGHO2_01_FULL_51_10]|uniref:Holliday junction branch migration complex subunit RuvA n=1 Tax=Candidatus Yonathbacteria bacterium RIFCSPHIGHO2_01_FULL_51_10 TaxID=1802723 RepID=A0A1G2S3V9_9BACT|nr:MAG: Holliday junction DNA helicase RuvA [Candidatus Yonathbacteria bacterium RIFCSPHIGHO2_01_FULL_51_10]
MIGKLTGVVAFKGDRFIILEAGPVGYKVHVTLERLRTIPREGEGSVSLWIHTVVREDALDLYGFGDRSELDLFEKLIGISGVGPKSALSILSMAPVETLRRAISSGDTTYLTKVSGIGRKIAEKIVIELKETLGFREENGIAGLAGEIDAIEALEALGYSQREARDALSGVPKDIVDASARIKEALKLLGNTKR